VSETVNVLGVAGSLRRASFNRGLLRAAVELAVDGIAVEAADLSAIPLYNADIEELGTPEPVEELRERVRAADGLLIATPEYNYSIPGVLKNAIDWVSRPPATSALRHKPIALVGASPGGFGTVRSQLALRQVFVFTDSYVMPKPELWVSRARDHFDADGNLIDDSVRDELRRLLEGFASWIRRTQNEE
jgi:chromate reductase